MSVIGPRPGLWNQDILTAERDKYNANDVKPGLTGWAQINGRDELEIPDKAKLDSALGINAIFSGNLSEFLSVDFLWETLAEFGITGSVIYFSVYFVPQFLNYMYGSMYIYRLDHAVTANQKVILKAFGLDANSIKYFASELSKELKEAE